MHSAAPMNRAAAGEPAFRLTLAGSGFVVGSRARRNGRDRATTHESSTILTAVIPGSDLPATGDATVTVWSPGPGGGESGALTFEVMSGLCTTDVSPSLAPQQGDDFKLTVFGENFGAPPILLWNGQPLSTVVVSRTQLTATVPASLVTTGGTAKVSLSSGAVASNAVSVPITLSQPVPLVSRLSPESVAPSSGAFMLLVEGNNFVANTRGLQSRTRDRRTRR